MRASSRVIVVLLVTVGFVVGAAAQDLKPGEVVPDCSKIPLMSVAAGANEERGSRTGTTLESLLADDGVTIVHFCSPRGPRRAEFKAFLFDELQALTRAAYGVPYPCRIIPVVPLGAKGARDATTSLAATLADEAKQREAETWPLPQMYYEPTFPRPGLYRTFRPGATALADRGIATPYTVLLGPDRKIIAIRGPEERGQLGDWLQQALPERVVAIPQPPSTDLSVPRPDPWEWPAFRRTAQHQAATDTLPDVLPYSYLAWTAQVGRTFASPAVMGRRVYVATDSQGLRMVSLDTGEVLGSYAVGRAWWSSPVVAGDLVYTVSADGSVLALNRLTLAVTWKQNLHGLITSSPVVAHGTMYVGARDGALYALDAASGEVLWQFQTGGAISSSPALAPGLVLIGSGDRTLYAIDDRTGQEKWSVATDGPVDSSPTVAGEEVVVGSFDGRVYAVRLSNGAVIWSRALGGWVHSSPAVAEGTVFVGTVSLRRDQVPAFSWLDRKTGALKGQFELPDSVYSSPTIWANQVLVGCRDGRLYAFDRDMKQTQPLWSYRTKSYLHASPVVAGDTVLIASFDGNLYALRQSRPIQVWKDNDVVPRWFIAGLARQLHQEPAELIARAAGSPVGTELSLTPFATLFARLREQVAQGAPPPKVLPQDVPGTHPGAPFIEYALTAGLLRGYPDGTFHPSEPATRYQLAMALATSLEPATKPNYVWTALKDRNVPGVEVVVDLPAGLPQQLRDVPEEHWAYETLTRQAERGLLAVDEEGRFRGQKLLTLKDAGEQWDCVARVVKVVRRK